MNTPERSNLVPRTMGILVQTAPEMKIPLSFLNYHVAYLLDEQRVQTMGEFIAVNLPEIAQTLHGHLPKNPVPVKWAFELTYEELKASTLDIYKNNPFPNKALMDGNRSYTYQELIHEIENETKFGVRLMASHGRAILFNEELVAQGKLIIDLEYTPKPFKLPDFPF